jgi:dipeptidyl aminopeptidase/acylaminoacyl peptidase
MQSTPLIARSVLFGNPDKASAQISPDGTRLAFLADVNGVLNVWVGPINKPDAARPVTHDTKRGIRQYHWAFNNNHILYLQDKDGDENWHVYATALATRKTTDLTPFDGVQARIQQISHKFPNEVLIGLNDRDKRYHDIFRINIAAGDSEMIEKNDVYAGYSTDEDFRLRFALKMTEDGGAEYFQPQGGDWSLWQKIPADDVLTTGPAGFDKAGDTLYMMDSRQRNTGALYAVNLKSNKKELIAEDARADVADIMAHPTENTIEAVAFNYDRQYWKTIDDNVRRDMEYLRTVADGDIQVNSRSLDDKNWIVAYIMDNGPVRYYHYDRPARRANFLFTNRKALQGLPLAKMHPRTIPSRDGLELVSYLSLPPWTDRDNDGKPQEAMPLVLWVHGGPWARDSWGLDPYHQWLTNRGYAVLSVNFRGSTGFGKSFIKKANFEWSGQMHDDLIDAVEWAIDQKIARRDKIAIMGGSYGGYATLVGLTFTPDVFACGVDIVGPSSLVTLLESTPPYWKPIQKMFTSRVGDHETDEGRELLTRCSPLTRVDMIKRPLLIGQGANDPRVKQAESDQIVKVMQSKNIPVTYILFPDEGHGFARPENRQAFNAVTELFLARHLGGRVQPIGMDFKGSTIKAPAGADELPGLADKLPRG